MVRVADAATVTAVIRLADFNRRLAVYDGIITLPWGGFPRSIARQPRGCQYRTIRLRKGFLEMFPIPTFLVPPLFQLPRYRAWKIGSGGECDIPGSYINMGTLTIFRDIVLARY